MRKRGDDYRDCIVCGEQFGVGRHNGNAKTCSPACAKERRRQTKRAYLPTEYVHRRVRRAADPDAWRAKEAESARKQRARNPQPGRDRARKYQAENPEAVKAVKARHYSENRDKVRAAQRNWERQNRDKINARKRRDYAAKKGRPVRPWRPKPDPEQ